MSVEKTFRNGITINIDQEDQNEFSKASNLGHINPSLEFYLVENASSYSKALIVGAGCGVATGILVDASVETHNVEPILSRYTILNSNFPDETNYQKACDETASDGSMYYYNNNKSGAKLNLVFGNGSESVEVITIDSLSLTDLDLIIVNTNGSEVDVLKGATNTIANNPGIKIIINWRPDLINSINTAIQYLQDNFDTVNIIHWETDDSISLKTQFTENTVDHLRAVMTAELLLE